MLAREGEAVPLASDHPEALEVVAGLVSDASMVPVVVGGLARARDFDPGTPVWNSGMNAGQLRAALDLPA
jgi:predicted dinucleotide-binding enzyme